MQQWIPRTQTLEPRIWGQIGLRQGFYMGLGVLGGIMFLLLLAPLGLAPRVAASLLALAGGVAVGFLKIKGLSPERYLLHRLRFALRRQGLGVWQVPNAPAIDVEVELRAPAEEPRATPMPATASPTAKPGRVAPARTAPATRWSECMVEASPFGMGFYLAALGAMGTAVAYAMEFPLP